MKKLILGITACVFLTGMPFSNQAQEKTPPEHIRIPDPPKFASQEANKEVGELVSLLKTYAPAMRNKDTAKLMEFGIKMQAWQQNANGLNELTPEEQTQFQTYMQSVGSILNPSATPAPQSPPSKK